MYQKIVKPILDFSIALFGLTVLIPLFLLVTIGLSFVNNGKPFFYQLRPGKNGRLFKIIKFKTMNNKKDSQNNLLSDGQRLTKIGKFVRKTSLDEVPQLLNVLMGDMSVVGPRPHLWSQNKAYGNKIKKYMVRHYVKPGITGLAQVRGFRGEIETDEDMINRIKYDVFYIENWSLILDLKIIAQTVINIFKGEEKAY